MTRLIPPAPAFGWDATVDSADVLKIYPTKLIRGRGQNPLRLLMARGRPSAAAAAAVRLFTVVVLFAVLMILILLYLFP